MRKLMGFLLLGIFLIFLLGCKPTQPAPPKLEVETAEEEIGAVVSEINEIETDVDISGLEEMEKEIEELEKEG